MRGHGARVPILVGMIGLLPAAASPQVTSSGASGKAVEPADRAAPGAAIAGQLRRGEWAPALAAAQAGIDRELAASQDPPMLTHLVAWRAVAEAGLQRADDAEWDWQVAQNLAGGWPISWEDLSSFGEAAKLLARHPLRKVGEAPAGLDVRKASSAAGAASEVKPARIASAAPPPLPPARPPVSRARSNLRSVPWIRRSMLSRWAIQIRATPSTVYTRYEAGTVPEATAQIRSIAGNRAADPSSDPSDT